MWWETLWDHFWCESDCIGIMQLISLTLWNIWKVCNKGVFEFISPNLSATSFCIPLSHIELQQYSIFSTPSSYRYRRQPRQEV